MSSLSDAAQALLDAARKAGASAADCQIENSHAVSVDVRNGQLEQAEQAAETTAGLRVFVGQQQATVSTSRIDDPDQFVALAERAVAIAEEAPEDPFALLAEADTLATETDMRHLELNDQNPDPSPGELEARAKTAEAAARDVKGVTQIDSSSSSFSRSSVFLATSNGFSAGFTRSNHSTFCVAISGTGTNMDRDYHHDSRVMGADLIPADEIGRVAGERAVARSGAEKPETGTYPVLFSERISGSLIGHLLSAINGEAIARGASWLRDDLGKIVLPETLWLKEDPHRKRITGSRLFDAEGLATSPRNIIENGVLTDWILDLSTAKRLGRQSTANARRSTGGSPHPSAGNMSLTEGEKSFDDLVADMGTGLLVTSLIGSTINPNTGDYSRGASGFWVESGKISHPVNECTIAGNLRDMLGRIIPANDARQHLSRVIPSLLIEGMSIAGK